MTTKPDFCEDFSFTKGPIHTSTPWGMPDIETFAIWWESFLPVIGQTPFYAWLCGGFLEGRPDTWDVDIILTKRTDLVKEDFQLLRDLMLEATELALNKHNILVDMQFYENFSGKDIAIDGVKSFWYSTDNYLKGGVIDSTKWVAFDSVYKNNEKLVDYRDPGSPAVEVMENLWKVTVPTPSEKYTNRIKNHGFIEPEPRLLFAPGEYSVGDVKTAKLQLV